MRRFKEGKAVVLNREKSLTMLLEKGIKRAAQEVDVGDHRNFGRVFFRGLFQCGPYKARIKLGGGKTYLTDVPVYNRFCSRRFFLGATAMPEDDPRK